MRPLFSYELLALWFKSFYSWASSIAQFLSVKYTSCNEQSKIFYRATIKSNLKTVFVHSLLREMAGWACIGPFSVQSFDPIRCPPRAVFGMSFGLILHTPEPITSASSQGLSAVLYCHTSSDWHQLLHNVGLGYIHVCRIRYVLGLSFQLDSMPVKFLFLHY